jgi:hypothetical protein
MSNLLSQEDIGIKKGDSLLLLSATSLPSSLTSE